MRADPGDRTEAADPNPQADDQTPIGAACNDRALAAGRAGFAGAPFAAFGRRLAVGEECLVFRCWRSSAGTRSSGPLSNVGSRRAPVFPLFDAITRPDPQP